MSDPVRPALSAEGWRMFGGDAIESAENFIHQTHGDETQEEVAEHMHAVAALALYGQPFGFTHEDVRRLHQLGSDLARTQHAYADGEFYLDLAARISALLPPEKK